jgi:hypothetical protein
MEKSARELVENAMAETGWSLDEIAERIDYKSIKRAMSGEIPLPESRRIHLNDLILLRKAYGPRIVDRAESSLQELEPLHASPARHAQPVSENLRVREEPEKSIVDALPHEEYASAVNMIGHLFAHHPKAFEALMVSLRGIYETHKEKKK